MKAIRSIVVLTLMACVILLPVACSKKESASPKTEKSDRQAKAMVNEQPAGPTSEAPSAKKPSAEPIVADAQPAGSAGATGNGVTDKQVNPDHADDGASAKPGAADSVEAKAPSGDADAKHADGATGHGSTSEMQADDSTTDRTADSGEKKPRIAPEYELLTAEVPGARRTVQGPKPGNPEEFSRRFPGTEEGLASIFSYFTQSGVDIREATQLLRPYEEDYEAIFEEGDFRTTAINFYQPKWERGTLALYGFVPGAQFEIRSVTTDELRANANMGTPGWPKGYIQVAPFLKKGLTLYRVLLTSDTYPVTKPWDFFVYVNGHWTMFSRAYHITEQGLHLTSKP